jgi:DNA-binding GntR family transcriptional regulator
MFEVSRVPVRDALQMLIGMGLAVNVPRRGVIVRSLSQKHLDDLFEVRKILEGAAIRLLVQNATPDLYRRLRDLIRQQSECLRRGDVKSQAKLDDAFHETLYGSIGNHRLRELILSNWEMIKQARCASVVVLKHGRVWIATSIARHKRILTALRKGDAEAAAIISENIESSKREIADSLREMGWLDGGDRLTAKTPPKNRSPKRTRQP